VKSKKIIPDNPGTLPVTLPVIYLETTFYPPIFIAETKLAERKKSFLIINLLLSKIRHPSINFPQTKPKKSLKYLSFVKRIY
jgi:hypothetical protein